MQSKKQSLKETLTNTFVGMAGSFGITMLCLQFFTEQVAIAATTTFLCTVWSIARGYGIRRYYNSKQILEKVNE